MTRHGGKRLRAGSRRADEYLRLEAAHFLTACEAWFSTRHHSGGLRRYRRELGILGKHHGYGKGDACRR
jgi:hypothetical protein